MITNELLKVNGATREEYERDLQQLREWAKAYNAALRDSRIRKEYAERLRPKEFAQLAWSFNSEIKQEFCERNEELDSLFKEVSD